jgi:hypothetical protein
MAMRSTPASRGERERPAAARRSDGDGTPRGGAAVLVTRR